MMLAWWRKLTSSKSQRAKRRARRLVPGQLFRRLQLERLEDRLAPAIHTWTGALNNLWSNSANWAQGSPAGDSDADLIFPAGAQNIDPNNNDLPGLSVHSVKISGAGYNIVGNGITLNAGITLTT